MIHHHRWFITKSLIDVLVRRIVLVLILNLTSLVHACGMCVLIPLVILMNDSAGSYMSSLIYKCIMFLGLSMDWMHHNLKIQPF